jgi:O-methyltransferase
VKGFFRDTLARHAERRFSFVHLDCDIYESYKECLEFFYSRTSRGGIVLFDEYKDPRWPGCTKAIDEFLADKPEKPVLVMRENRQKFYVQKL